MAKIKTYLFGILLFISCIDLSGQNAGSKLVIDTYRKEIGVRELTGHNDGVRVETYLASCHLKKGNPWCAAFITWTYKTAGIKAVVSGYAPNWFQGKNIVYMRGSKKNTSPVPADVFGIYFPSKKRIAHVGFIDEWKSGSVAITVEGNTNEAGSREGDGVYRKRRLKSQIYKISRWI
jgi:hypothetical protein